MVLSDPPYFIEGLDNKWEKGKKQTTEHVGSVKGLPVGMKFDPKQGIELHKFMKTVGKQWIRVLKPGGFALIFSQPRLAHRIAMAMEDVGFEIRDLICWKFTQRAKIKAFTQDHFVKRMNISEKQKRKLIASMNKRCTPQLRPQFEAVILAQKPKDGTFVNNWILHKVGLINIKTSLNHLPPSNVMECSKPPLKERKESLGHLTPKPVRLLKHIIKLYTKKHQVVLDSFLGSGSTAVAAIQTNRKFIGIEINSKFIKIAKKRIKKYQS